MTTIFAKKVLLHDGWADNARLSIRDGLVQSVERALGPEPDDEIAGIVIPGLANAHSHAFQRALAGHTEFRGPRDKDNFWSWRTRMYRLAGVVNADRLYAIACQAYTEMLIHGYTSVAEFHYLHSEPGSGGPDNAMLGAIARAAEATGIRLTYVPVLYERAGFGHSEPTEHQRRFVMTLDAFKDHYENATELACDHFNTGIGVHSLRAVSALSLDDVQQISQRDGCPMHIHVAEQTAEVEQCIAETGLRPVEFLLRHYDLDERWCLVHATHINDDEIKAVAESGAVVCLCPSTEANLGDGLFPLRKLLEQGGQIAIGSDSHITINPFEELRWLEYGQRLITRTRNVAAIRRPQTGRSLFEQSLEGGAAACGQPSAGLKKGALADLITLDDDNPMLVGHGKESILDALVFSGFTLPIDRVMVNGRWVVEGGRHAIREDARKNYVTAIEGVKSELELAP